jgi:hypothetical protein
MNTVTAPHNGKLRTFNLSSSIQHLQFKDGSGWVPGLSGSDPNDVGGNITDDDANTPTAPIDLISETLKVLKALNGLQKKSQKIVADHRDLLTSSTAGTSDLSAKGQKLQRADTVQFAGDTLNVTGKMDAIRAQFNAVKLPGWSFSK